MNNELLMELLEVVGLHKLVNLDELDGEDRAQLEADAIRMFYIKKRYFSAGIRIAYENAFDLTD